MVFVYAKAKRQYFLFFILLLVPVFRVFEHYLDIKDFNQLTIFASGDALAIGCILCCKT
jgi:hypothetical protein